MFLLKVFFSFGTNEHRIIKFYHYLSCVKNVEFFNPPKQDKSKNDNQQCVMSDTG